MCSFIIYILLNNMTENV